MAASKSIGLLFEVEGGSSIDGASGQKITKQLTQLVEQINKHPEKYGKVKLEIDKNYIAEQIKSSFSNISDVLMNASGNATKKATKNIAKQIKVLNGSDISKKLGVTTFDSLESRIKALSSSMSTLSKTDIKVDGDNNVTGAILTYKDALGNVVTETLKWRDVTTQASDGAEETTRQLCVTQMAYKQNIEATTKAQERQARKTEAANKRMAASASKAKAKVQAANAKGYFSVYNQAETVANKAYGNLPDYLQDAIKAVNTAMYGDGETKKSGFSAFFNNGQIQYANGFKSSLKEVNKALAEYNAAYEQYKKNNSENSGARGFASLTSKATEFFNKYKATLTLQQKSSINEYITKLNNNSFGNDISSAKAEWMKLEAEIQSSGNTIETLGQKVKRIFTEKLGYGAIATAAMYARRTLREMYDTVVELDSALTQLSIVTNTSMQTLKNNLDSVATSAKEANTTITDILSSTEIYARLGYSLSEAQILATTTGKFANVANISTDDATTGITAILKGYQKEASDVEGIADILTKVGQEYAISASELATGLSEAGATLALNGTDLEQSAAILAAGNAAIQDASKVGNAIKTSILRIRGTKADISELEDMGEDVEDLAEGTSKLRDEIKAMSGVDILDATGQYRNFYDILVDLSVASEKMDTMQLSATLEALAGKRNASVIASILTNVKDLQGAYESASNSAGALETANQKFSDSIEGRMSKVKTSFQSLSNDVMNSSLIKGGISFLNGVIVSLDGILDKTGLLIPVLGYGLVKAVQTLRKETASMNAALSLVDTTKGITSLSAFKSTGGGLTSGQAREFFDILTSNNLISGKDTAKNIEAYLKSMEKLDGKTLSVSNNFKKLGKSLKEFAISPLGKATIAAAALIAAYKALEYYFTRADGYAEKLSELKSELSEISNNISDAESKLAENNKRIAELNALKKAGTASLIDESELSTLKAENEELKTNIEYWKTRNAEKNKEKQKAFVKWSNATDTSESFGVKLLRAWASAWGSGADMERETADLVGSPSEMIQRYLDYLNYGKEYGDEALILKFGISLDEVESKLSELWDNVDENTDGLELLPDDGTEQTREYNKALQELIDLRREYTYATGDASAKTSVFNTILSDDRFKGAKEQILELIDSNGTEYAEDSPLGKLIAYLIELGIISPDAADKLSLVKNMFKKTEEAASKAATSVSSFKNALSNVNSIEKNLKSLGEMLNDFKENGKIDWSDLEDLYETFEGLEGLDDYVKNIASASTYSEASNAITALAEAYLNQSDTLTQLGKGYDDLIIARLKSMGVTNAEKVAEERVAIAKINSTATTVDECDALIKEAEASNMAASYVALLYQRKIQLALASINTSSDVNNLIALADAANLSTQQLNRLYTLKQYYADIERITASNEYRRGGYSALSSADKQALSTAQRMIERDKQTGISSSTFSLSSSIDATISGSALADFFSKDSGSSSDKNQTAAEKYFAKLKYLYETNQISELTYLKKMDAGYKKYYGDKSKYLSENEEYSQEVYEGFKDMYKEDLEAQKDALEEKIDALEEAKDKELEALEELYDKRKELLEQADEEDKYIKDQSDKRKTVNDLKAQIAILERDTTSASAQKKLLELREQLAEAEEDLKEFEDDKALDDKLAALDAELEKKKEETEKKYQEKIDTIKSKVTTIDEKLDTLNTNTTTVKNVIVAYAKKKGVTLNFSYASGTSNSVSGWGRTQENGSELIGARLSDGSYATYIPRTGSKVFNAKATEFLYNLANSPSKALSGIISQNRMAALAASGMSVNAPTEIVAGDIYISGNADQSTVSALKKANDDMVYKILSEFRKLR